MSDRVDELAREVETLRRRVSLLIEATSRITATLDVETMLQGVLDGARSLAAARYGLILLFDQSADIQELLTSGLTASEVDQLVALPDGPALAAQLRQISGPARFEDFHEYTASAGFAEFRLPVAVESPATLLTAPIRYEGTAVGHIYLAGTAPGTTFSSEDEEILAMFASQAGMVISNARRLQDEQRVRADLETLIDTAPVGVILFDARTGMPISLNREALRITNDLRRAVESAEDLVRMVTVRGSDNVEVPLVDALRTGGVVRLAEVVVQVPDGSSVTVLVNATPVHSPDGELESVVATLQDLKPLEEVAQLRSEFLAMVSHELRVPLAAIKGSTTTLLESAADLRAAEVREFHRIIDEQADGMRDLIGELLDAAQIETGTLTIDPEPVAVEVIVDEARSRFQNCGDGESLRIDLPDHLPPVMGDKRRIVQILDNLLSNAAKFSPPSSPIRLAAEHDQVRVTFSISDEGRGLAPEDLQQLFGTFSRTRSRPADGEVGGAGLGLVICRGIVEAHGGRIWAESDGPEQGSRFAFTVPVAEFENSLPATSRGPRGDGQDQPRVLVVDDDPRALRHTRDILTNAGYAAIPTGDPGNVVRLLTKIKPDVILMDLMLPGTDGIAVMSRIRNITEVPVIFVSAFAQPEIVSRALDAGAVDYIIKPFSPAELTARIRVALRQSPTQRVAEPSEPSVHGDLVVDYRDRLVTLAGRPLRLTATEYRLLVELSTKAGRVVTHEELLRHVWGLVGAVDLRPMRTAIRALRGKLSDDARNPTYIFTESRVGYRMLEPSGNQLVNG